MEGIALIFIDEEMFGDASTSTFTITVSKFSFFDISSSSGASILQGPHQLAEKTTSAFLLLEKTSSRFLSLNSNIFLFIFKKGHLHRRIDFFWSILRVCLRKSLSYCFPIVLLRTKLLVKVAAY